MSAEAKKMVLNKVTDSLAKSAFEGSDEIYSILDTVPFNLMFCGMDHIIKYVNPMSFSTLEKIEDLLPVSISKVLGSKIDIFHKDPKHQQKILSNPRNLPLNSNIKLGEEDLNLQVFPIVVDGEFKGSLLSWEVITEQLKLEKLNENFSGVMNAISKTQAVIEFNLDGIVQTANENFLTTLGYRLEEIQGKHHSLFCDPAYVETNDYRNFWLKLNRGEFDSGQYKRIGKGKKEVWIQAAYNPIFDSNGKVIKVVKFASDITKDKTEQMKAQVTNENLAGIMNAISKTQAVIEFNLEGIVQTANDNFLDALGYRLDDIRGKHHSMFCEPAYTNTSAYRDFWLKLNRGEFDAGQYKRIGKGGKEIWIQAAYNPVFDVNGKVVKVVKFASDITKQKMEAVSLIRSLSEAERSLAAAAEEMTATATQLTANSAKTTAHSNSASAGAEEVSKGVSTVATNTEEMTASIKEISKSTASAAQMSRDSQLKAQETNKIILKLGTSSSEIGTVVKVISSIAQQTNLLALNATIEAARAGDAGKGFAVVANEVKELAKQTAKATEEISSKIGAIQKDTDGAVLAMGEIAKAIEQLNNISVSISASVEEQTATTNEVTRIVLESSKAVTDVALTIKEVSKMSGESSAGAAQTLDAARNLSKLATELSSLVKRVEATF